MDSLCGLYAVLNATRLLCPELGYEGSRSLFRQLAETLTAKRVTAFETVAWGIEMPTVLALIQSARTYVREVLDTSLRLEPFRSVRKTLRIGYLWKALMSRLKEGWVAIIGISGHHNHWTVAHRATAKSMRLFDSDLMTTLKRSRCSLRCTRAPHQIDPGEIFLLRREAG
ncbi:MAG: hypothetical protein KF810_07185 [Rhizobiaceae bacterium]|nr:hypothetical protein [Rhizobiaceae bacterium]